ncbi:serine hydrolase domain-containing protein [Haloechinothrix halophila]|uniref:serine hydrolase domain-containing protein n=1 Tax=Haloechinothrix halophila TaxID=1069073 RepID=UPI0003F795E3|nr:serine hydrolase [Haloechinothrix halophila]
MSHTTPSHLRYATAALAIAFMASTACTTGSVNDDVRDAAAAATPPSAPSSTSPSGEPQPERKAASRPQTQHRRPAQHPELPASYTRLLAEADHAPLDERGAAAEPEQLTIGDGQAITPGGPGSLKDPSTTEVFDVEVFEQNIKVTLQGETVGFAYAIGEAGQLSRQGGVGLARTAADGGPVPQSAMKDITVASVSKPITTVAALRVLADKGIDVDDQIGPWLPGTWEPGDGVAELTFQQLMTHTSGLRQNYETATGKGGKVTAAYDNIKIAVEQDLGSTSYSYANMNFGIFRIMLPAMLLDTEVPGYDFSVPLAAQWDELTAEIFNDHMEDLFASVGVTGSCAPSDSDATVLYRFPYDDASGWQTESYVAGCGGYGYYLSANDLTGFFSHLRYTDELLSPATRDLMRDGKLGLQTVGGEHGTYYGHNGAWGISTGAMTSCVLSFPIHVDASLVINSSGGDYGSTCGVLATAFDDAWVPAG